MKKLAALIMTALLLLAAATPAMAASQQPTIALKESTTACEKGDQLTITLSSNASTGYSWSCSLSDTSVLALKSDESNSAKKGRIGAAGSQTFTFEALADGTAVITLQYMRPWESVQPTQTKAYTVVVGSGADATTKVTAQAGEQFVIDLPYSASTGYSWNSSLPDSSTLRRVSTKRIAATQNLPGAQGVQRFTFLAKKSGTVDIAFTLTRATDKKNPIETRIYTATIASAAKARALSEGINNCAVGDTVSVTVSSNASTGYSWAASISGGTVLELVSEKYNQPASSQPGAAGSQTFTFRVIAKGESTITLRYTRPWEDVSAETKTYTISTTGTGSGQLGSTPAK